jgi:hypothetical protein
LRRDALLRRLDELDRRRDASALGAHRREQVRQSRESMREEGRVAREQAREEFRRMMLEDDAPMPSRPMRPRSPSFG